MFENNYVLLLEKYVVYVLLYFFSELVFVGVLFSYEMGWFCLVDVFQYNKFGVNVVDMNENVDVVDIFFDMVIVDISQLFCVFVI